MARKKTGAQNWTAARLAPVVLVKSEEPLLGDRAVANLRGQALKKNPDLDVQTLDAPRYEGGQLQIRTSPSLFEEPRFILVDDAQDYPPSLVTDTAQYLEQPLADTTVVYRHNGKTGKRKLLDLLSKAQVPTYEAPAMTRLRDKMAFIESEVQTQGRKIERSAVQMLVDALGSDVAELVAVTHQLLADVNGTITEADVRRYQAGKVETTGFAVVDAAVSGNLARSLLLLRSALAQGIAPAALTGAAAMKIRQLAKVSVRPRPTARELKMAPWQIDRAARELRGWNETRLAQAVNAVAKADHEVKGASKDPHYALECMLKTISGRVRM
ncbi:DNA polymerase III subunit delta [Gleimia hominis]|uniref:DNA polymerase III subunit delta n=1 Tax=Gleimia hominis TaxID=595468 RepID=UPI000C7F864F|nr:DNA polymerase III subunit delta [Gleimia hominis]WIK64891.1 DNA polymerase III subunit delta [Gleimia hominis]